VIGAQIARPDRPAVSLLAGLIVSMAIGVIGYHFLPIAGPRYLNNGFPLAVPGADLIPLEALPLPPVPRNGMPSMHFAWAVLLWLTARQLGNRWLYGFFSILFALTFVATMATGEHYLIDLVAAIPVAVTTVAIVAGTVPWSDPARKRAALGGLAIWLAWIVALRFAVPVFEAIPGLSWIAIAATVWASVMLYRPLMRAFERDSRDACARAVGGRASGSAHLFLPGSHRRRDVRAVRLRGSHVRGRLLQVARTHVRRHRDGHLYRAGDLHGRHGIGRVARRAARRGPRASARALRVV
jgi:hypothetical protein